MVALIVSEDEDPSVRDESGLHEVGVLHALDRESEDAVPEVVGEREAEPVVGAAADSLCRGVEEYLAYRLQLRPLAVSDIEEELSVLDLVRIELSVYRQVNDTGAATDNHSLGDERLFAVDSEAVDRHILGVIYRYRDNLPVAEQAGAVSGQADVFHVLQEHSETALRDEIGVGQAVVAEYLR